MSPSPGPAAGAAEQLRSLEVIGIELIAILVLMLALVSALGVLIYRAGLAGAPSSALVIVLGVLALVSALGYLLGGDERAELITIAAAAVGALAGALTMLTRPQDGAGRPESGDTRRDGHGPDDEPDGPQRPP